MSNWIFLFVGRVGKLTEEQKILVGYIMLFLALVLGAWGAVVLIRYFYIKKLIQRKLQWSYNNDAFWNYDDLVEAAKQNYIKAQLFLNSTKYESLPFLTPHAKAKLRLIKKRIRSEKDIQFTNTFIVWFKDKKVDVNDQVCVYLDLKIKGASRNYKEMIVMQREEDSSMIVIDVIRNPTIYMIAHSRSIIEKY